MGKKIGCTAERWCALALSLLVLSLASPAADGQAATTPQKVPSALGTIKTISGNTLLLTTDNGSTLKVQLPTDVRLLQVEPGSKDLKEAIPLQVSDLQVGDRVLVQMKPGEDGSFFIALRVIAMKKADIAQKQAKEREDWQRRGIGGLVKSVDAASNSITIGTMATAGSKDVTIHVGKDTVLRRYAPGSIKFDEAKPAPIVDIHSGDQLRARGTRSADGNEFTADEIVSGAFRNIAGPIVAVDAGAGTLTVNDIATKKPVELKVTPDTQMRKVPDQVAQRIAMRLKGGGGAPAWGGGIPGQNAGQPPAGSPPAGGGQAQGPGGGAGPGGSGAGAQRGGGDMQQMLSRLPTSPLGDFQKGDVVMLVATSGQNEQTTVITMLGGVEPILEASTGSQAESILSPWSMSQGGAGGDMGTP
jgi:Domain of unknown function (DUF5666)